MSNAFRFLETQRGMCSYETYPYLGKEGFLLGCAIGLSHCDMAKGSKVIGYKKVQNTDVALKKAVHEQPVTVAINAGLVSLNFKFVS